MQPERHLPQVVALDLAMRDRGLLQWIDAPKLDVKRLAPNQPVQPLEGVGRRRAVVPGWSSCPINQSRRIHAGLALRRSRRRTRTKAVMAVATEPRNIAMGTNGMNGKSGRSLMFLIGRMVASFFHREP